MLLQDLIPSLQGFIGAELNDVRTKIDQWKHG